MFKAKFTTYCPIKSFSLHTYILSKYKKKETGRRFCVTVKVIGSLIILKNCFDIWCHFSIDKTFYKKKFFSFDLFS